MDKRKQYVLDTYGQEPSTLDQLAECVIAVIESQKNWGHNNCKPASRYQVAGFAWNISFGMVSNSHSCPVDGVTNWGRREPNTPVAYYGWNGRVWIRYKSAARGFGHDPFSATLTHTGTGGGGSYSGPFSAISLARFRRYGHMPPQNAYPEVHCYSWDYRIFLDDWPGLKDHIEKEKIIAALSGVSYRPRPHKFNWIDPATAEADEAFIKECQGLQRSK